MLELLGNDGGQSRIRGASRQRRKSVAQASRFGIVAMRMTEVDEFAQLVDVLDRVLQRRLPGGKQRYCKKDPR